jgi:hypothetical protein
VYLLSKIENEPVAWGLVALTEKDFLEHARLGLRSAILAKDQGALGPICLIDQIRGPRDKNSIARIRVG